MPILAFILYISQDLKINNKKKKTLLTLVLLHSKTRYFKNFAQQFVYEKIVLIYFELIKDKIIRSNRNIMGSYTQNVYKLSKTTLNLFE